MLENELHYIFLLRKIFLWHWNMDCIGIGYEQKMAKHHSHQRPNHQSKLLMVKIVNQCDALKIF